jgi:hypothetical protein
MSTSQCLTRGDSPKVRNKGNNGEDRDVADSPDRGRDQGRALVDARFPPEEDGEQE